MKFVAVTNEKNAEGKIGLTFVDGEDGVVITKISDVSPFANTEIKLGMTILTVNTISCHGLGAAQVRSIIAKLPNTITLIAAVVSAGIYTKDIQLATAETKSGVGLELVDDPTNGRVRIAGLAPDSPFAGSAISGNILTINDLSCDELDANQVSAICKSLQGSITLFTGTLTTVAPEPPALQFSLTPIQATVQKDSEGKIGLSFVQTTDGSVLIKRISESSPFVDTPIEEGMSILTINSISCRGMDPLAIRSLFKTLEGDITLIAAPPAGLVFKNIQAAEAHRDLTFAMNEKYGTVQLKSGLDENRAIVPDMTVISVDDICCSGMDDKQVQALCRETVGTKLIFLGHRTAGRRPTATTMEFYAITVNKNENGKLGAAFQDQADGTVALSRIGDDSPLANSIVETGMILMTVNGISCQGVSAVQVGSILASLPDPVTLCVAKRGVAALRAKKVQAVTAQKTAEGRVGLSLMDRSDGAVAVTKVAEDSPFADTDLTKDMVILSINNIPCSSLEANQLRGLFAALPNPITIVAGTLMNWDDADKRPTRPTKFVAATVAKTPTGKVGLAFADHASGTVVITKIGEDSPFAGTVIQEGMTVVTINSVSCHGMNAKEVRSVFQSLPESVTLIAAHLKADVQAKSVQVATINKMEGGKVGLSMADSHGTVIISSISEQSPFAATPVKEGMTILSINNTPVDGMDAYQIKTMFWNLPDPVTLIAGKLQGGNTAPRVGLTTASFVTATVEKNEGGKLGIVFSEGPNGSVVITKVSENSPFVGTKITEGMTVLTINGVSCHGMDTKHVKSIFASLGPMITLVAAKLSEGVYAKDIQIVTADRNAQGKVGINMVDRPDGSTVITNVADDSPFANTPVEKDTTILCVNNISCVGMDANQIKHVFASVPNPVTLCVGTVFVKGGFRKMHVTVEQ